MKKRPTTNKYYQVLRETNIPTLSKEFKTLYLACRKAKEFDDNRKKQSKKNAKVEKDTLIKAIDKARTQAINDTRTVLINAVKRRYRNALEWSPDKAMCYISAVIDLLENTII